ncbi:MAG TPA: class I SAM-dependent methyltransferase [Usitatibacter sp.]|nr:class I SAM-dependent methyltransferase [Usitatibacter sp.]
MPEAVIEKKVRGCPLGCAEAGSALGSLDKTAGFALSRDTYTLSRCGCGTLLYLSPAPTDDDLREMYVDHDQYDEVYTAPARVTAILEYIGGCFDRMSASREWRGPVRVLEVGAGLAWMCRTAKARDASSVTVAADLSPEAAQSCPWVDDYVVGTLEDPRVAARGPYHVISITHVIEHLVDPVSVLAQCRKHVAADGIVFVTAPHRPHEWREGDMDAWRRYSYNHVPAHIQYFAEGSMKRLADATGFTIAFWSHAHEGGEAFEAWLAPVPWWKRFARRLGL